MLANSPRRRRLLGLLAIFCLLNCAYLIAHWLIPSLAFPVVVGLSTVIILVLMHRWFTNLNRRLDANSEWFRREMMKQQAMINLTPLLQGAFVPFGEWAMEPVHMFDLLSHVRAAKVDVIVECGSGTSTLMLGNLLRQKGKGRLYSLEEDMEWYQFMARHIQEQGLRDWVTLVHAPLEPYKVNDDSTVEWYSTARVNEVLADVVQLDLLIVDGPKSASTLSRFPALPAFRSKITSTTLIVLDNVNRLHEQAVLAEWQKQYTLEIDYNLEADRHQAYIRVISTADQYLGNV